MIADREHQLALRRAVQARTAVTAARRVRPIRNPLPARVPDGAVYVGREGWGFARSPWANPHTEAVRSPEHPSGRPCRLCGGQVRHTREEAVALYRAWLRVRPALWARAREELVGRDLACWCPLPADGEVDVCHATVVLAVAAGGLP